MSTQPKAQGWKPKAYASIAKYYALLEEEASFKQRLEETQLECEKLGVDFRYGGPQVNGEDALICPCGTIVALSYENDRAPRVDGVLHCAPCREKSREAAKQDAKEEARVLPPQPAEVDF